MGGLPRAGCFVSGSPKVVSTVCWLSPRVGRSIFEVGLFASGIAMVSVAVLISSSADTGALTEKSTQVTIVTGESHFNRIILYPNICIALILASKSSEDHFNYRVFSLV